MAIASNARGPCVLLFTVDSSPVCARFRAAMVEAARERHMVVVDVDARAQMDVIEQLGVRHVPSGVLFVDGQRLGPVHAEARPGAIKAVIARMRLAAP